MIKDWEAEERLFQKLNELLEDQHLQKLLHENISRLAILMRLTGSLTKHCK